MGEESDAEPSSTRTKSIKPRQVAETGAMPFRMWGCEALNSMGWGTRRSSNEVESAVRTNGGGGHGPMEKTHFKGHLVNIDPQTLDDIRLRVCAIRRRGSVCASDCEGSE